MSASPHRLILASAGTGKTWQLSGRFLQLLLEGVEPRRILATTFTRKAAGEILDRVLNRLAEAAEDDTARAQLAQQVGRPLKAAEVMACLARLTGSLDQLRIRTLDAFFVHVAKLFALELGLPADWSIVEEAEDERLRREAVARTLATTERGELLGILRDLQRADASRTVERVLLRSVDAARNAYLDSHPEAWTRVTPPPGLDAEALAAALADLEAMPLPTTKAGTVRKHWRDNHDRMLAALHRGDWNGFLEVTLVERALEGAATFGGAEIEDRHSAPILALTPHAAHVLIGEVAALNRASLAWLQRFDTSYEALKSEEHAYRFEDLPKSLHPRDEDRLGDLERIWYRMDARIDHVLLDEFQDTAPVQWRILRRLADELLADGTGERSFFCVGDVKQSIYGWREAEPRLLERLAEAYPVLEPERMAKSYRSAPVILDTVGRVFATLGENAVFDDPDDRATAQEWQQRFDPHVAHHDLPGAAYLVEAPREGDRIRAALRVAALRARAIAEEAPEARIGILLRRNEPVPLALHLLRQQGLHAGGEGGSPLTDSAAVLALLSLLHLSEHPADTMAAFHVATSPLGPLAGFTTDGFRQQRGEVARTVRRRVALEGLGAFCAAHLDVVDAGYGSWDRRRFRQLIDLAHGFEDRAGLRTDRFVDHVRRTRVEDPAATQVQVMTVHHAKGLEFDAVILPELDVPLTDLRAALLGARPAPAGLLTSVSHSRSRTVCALDPDLEALYRERQKRELTEALCLLYVAMTRARQRLDLIVQPRSRDGKVSHTFASLLRQALVVAPPDADGVLWRHPDSTPDWFTPPQRAAAPAMAVPPSGPLFRAPATPRHLVTRAPSASEGGTRVDSGTLLRSPRGPARTTGDLVHLWMSQIEWLEDFALADEELLARAHSLGAPEDEVRAALAEFRAFLGQPSTRAALTRPAGAGPFTVWRERSFALVVEEDGEPVLASGAFDRVVLHGPPEAPTHAELLDYKTDTVTDATLAERIEFYRPQVESYRRALAHATGLAPTSIDARLLFLRRDRLETLAP